MLKRLPAIILALCGAWHGVSAQAVEQALIPIEDLARGPSIQSPSISPDGKWLALIETVEGRGTIVVRNLDDGESRRLYRNPDRSIDNVVWSADGRWLLLFQDAGGDEGFHLYRLDPRIGPSTPVDLTPFKGVAAELVRLPADAGSTAIITLNRRDPELADAYRVDLATGVLTELARNDEGFTEYHADARGRVLLATAVRAGGRLDVLARPQTTEAWRSIYSAAADERFKIVALTPDGATAIVKSNRGRATERLLRLGLSDGSVSALAGPNCGRFDDESVILDPLGKPAFGTCVAERATVHARNAKAATALGAIRRRVGGASSLFLDSMTPDLSGLIFYAEASDRPGEYLIYRNGRATRLGQNRPWLANRAFAPSRHYWIKARDGLELSVYVTRSPRSRGAQPTIIGIHGGPWSRDTGGFEPETQLLADRGYTVLQVNFRGSTGLGRRHFEAGVRQFGQAMSDDILDALEWASAKGMTDPARVCVMGGSYGGYATLVGLTRDAERFRCGIDFAGPVDLVTLVEAFPPSWKPFLPRSWYRFVGDPSDPADRAEMKVHSPLGQIGRIRAPLLIFQGANDPRVTQAQSDTITCGLRKRGITVDYLLAGNEGHSFGNEETGLAVNRATEQFLARHLGGRTQASVDVNVQKTLDGLRAAGLAIKCAQ